MIICGGFVSRTRVRNQKCRLFLFKKKNRTHVDILYIRKALFKAGLLICYCFSTGCVNDSSTTIPLPEYTIGVADISAGYAVLSGPPKLKLVSILSPQGFDILDFGVSKNANALSRTSANGPLFIAVSQRSKSTPSGAIERWTIDGAKTGSLSLPGPVMALATSNQLLIALVSVKRTRAIALINPQSLTLERVIPLPGNVIDFATCSAERPATLIVVDTNGNAIELEAGKESLPITSSVRSISCAGPYLYAIRVLHGASVLTIISLATRVTKEEVPLSRDAVRVLLGTADSVLVLGSQHGTSTLLIARLGKR